jgi:tetratricopeptide (TPR) repeat protein
VPERLRNGKLKLSLKEKHGKTSQQEFTTTLMKILRIFLRSAMSLALFALLSGCMSSVPRWGTGGHYEGGREEFLRGKGGNMDRAITELEAVVRENPTYKDSLTLLGRAYYNKTRYEDAAAILQRAVAINKDDEIAWIVLGAARLRLNQDEQGIEALKGGITLLSKATTVDGYRDYPMWDTRGIIRASIRRTAFVLTKEGSNKQEVLNEVNTLLARIDEEDNFQRRDTQRRYRRDY